MVELQPKASARTHQIECNLTNTFKILIFFTTSLVSSSNRRRHLLTLQTAYGKWQVATPREGIFTITYPLEVFSVHIWL